MLSNTQRLQLFGNGPLILQNQSLSFDWQYVMALDHLNQIRTKYIQGGMNII